MAKIKIITDLSTKTVSTDISILDDNHVDDIRKKFCFLDSYNIQAGIDDAKVSYQLLSKIPKEPTTKQSNKRLDFIQDKISELSCALNNLSFKEKTSIMTASENRPQKIYINDCVDYLNELSLQIVVAQLNQDDTTDRVGRNKKTHQSFFLSKLYSVYEDGTKQKVKCWYDDCEIKYKGAFVEFCEYVINIYGLGITNSSIGDFVKNKRKTISKKS